MRTPLIFLFLACLFCLVAPLLAQHEHPTAGPGQVIERPSSEPEEIGWVPHEILDRPVLLHDGLGPVHETIAMPPACHFLRVHPALGLS
jgi:hypothetical protein